MSFCWRIAKYDPSCCFLDGSFKYHEWTSYSDIGKIYNNMIFSYDVYIKMEDLYIQTIYDFMNCCAVSSLQVFDLEKPKKISFDPYDSSSMISLFKTVENKMWLTLEQTEDICKLILREKLWCKLANTSKIYVHFGYDFYMYIGTNVPCREAVANTEQRGLFIEAYESPYLK